MRFTGEDYLRHFVLPNFYFHATTTYALPSARRAQAGLRHRASCSSRAVASANIPGMS
jgi:hypothetical protein